MSICRYLCVLSLTGLLAGCNFVSKPEIVEPVVAAPTGELDFRILHKADYNVDDSVTVKSFRAIRTLPDYQTELARYSVEVTAVVDFSTSLVLASTMGTQVSGGYIVGVKKIEDYPDKVKVTVELVSPGENCLTTSAISNPYEFVEIPTIKPVEVVETARVAECS